jgi:type IV pilus assembly protein PilA
MKAIQKGFTLTELMIVVAIISILAAMAFPAYQDYTIRAKVSELILAASGYRTLISEKYETDPGGSASMGVGLTITVVGKISGGSVTDTGTITVTGSTASTSTGAGVTITMTPQTQTGGALTWLCGGTPSKYLPATCRDVVPIAEPAPTAPPTEPPDPSAAPDLTVPSPPTVSLGES